MKDSRTTYLTDFYVQIASLDGESVAETIPIKVEVWKDEESGEEILTPQALELIDRTHARHLGLMSSNEIRGLRKRLRRTQKQISDLLQAGEKTCTRWEAGIARPSRSFNILLCALRDGRIDIPYLESLAKPQFDWSAKVIDFPAGSRALTFSNEVIAARVKEVPDETSATAA